MTTEKAHNEADIPKNIKKLSLPDGFWVGIKNLDNSIREVANLKLADAKAIKRELLKRVEACNYVAPSAEDEYAKALYREYQQKFGEFEADKGGHKIETSKLPGG